MSVSSELQFSGIFAKLIISLNGRPTMGTVWFVNQIIKQLEILFKHRPI